MSAQDCLRRTAFSVYRQSRVLLAENVRNIIPKSMTRFGPASMMKDILDGIRDGQKNSQPSFYKVCNMLWSTKTCPKTGFSEKSKKWEKLKKMKKFFFRFQFFQIFSIFEHVLVRRDVLYSLLLCYQLSVFRSHQRHSFWHHTAQLAPFPQPVPTTESNSWTPTKKSYSCPIALLMTTGCARRWRTNVGIWATMSSSTWPLLLNIKTRHWSTRTAHKSMMPLVDFGYTYKAYFRWAPKIGDWWLGDWAGWDMASSKSGRSSCRRRTCARTTAVWRDATKRRPLPARTHLALCRAWQGANRALPFLDTTKFRLFFRLVWLQQSRSRVCESSPRCLQLARRPLRRVPRESCQICSMIHPLRILWSSQPALIFR